MFHDDPALMSNTCWHIHSKRAAALVLVQLPVAFVSFFK